MVSRTLVQRKRNQRTIECHRQLTAEVRSLSESSREAQNHARSRATLLPVRDDAIASLLTATVPSLSSIHSLGHRPLDVDHPENRAILYEDITYSKRKIQDFLAALAGLKVANEIVQIFAKHSDLASSSPLLHAIIYQHDSPSSGSFPAVNELLDYYTNAFSHTQARAEGKIIPTAGVCQQYDDALNEIRACEKSLNDYLNKQKKLLKNQDIKYVHVQKTRYAMEIPESACRHLDDDYELMNSRKGFKRSVAKTQRCTQSHFHGRGFTISGIIRVNYVN